VEIYEHRIVNGLLRELPDVQTPEAAQQLLARDVEICVNDRGKNPDDLWPCVWALAAALSKQFTGEIFVDFPEANEMPCPVKLCKRVILAKPSCADVIRIGVGVRIGEGQFDFCGDARGGRVTFNGLLERMDVPADPISCFAVAGYLGFAALARAVDIPKFNEAYICKDLDLSFDPMVPGPFPADGIAFLGLGQLGQAYLALLFFLARKANCRPFVFLLDKDRFEPANESTQILLEAGKPWCGVGKAGYLETVVRGWGWEAKSSSTELDWSFRRSKEFPSLAFLGFDNFEARRIAMNAGFDWVVEGGIGTSLAKPRVTWHSLPAKRELGQLLFSDVEKRQQFIDKEYFETLRRIPGQCGWFSFKKVEASAPAMGLAAAGYVWAEAKSALGGYAQQVAGMAYLWPSMLPFRRESLSLPNENAS